MMNVWILILLFITNVVTSPNASSKSPWFVQVVRKLPLIGDTICGGSLIYNTENMQKLTDMVLTSASCVKDVPPAAVSIILGSDILAVGEKVAVTQISSFPLYTGQDFSNDIAIIRLSKPVNFTKFSLVQPVRLPETKLSYDPESCRINGFLGGGFLHELKMSEKSCKEYKHFQQGSSFCAIDPKGADGPCAFDMGIPYVCSSNNGGASYLVGIASNNDACGGYRSDNLGLFTSVIKYKSWIESTMKRMNVHAG